MLSFSDKIESFTKELQAMRGETIKSPTISQRPTVNQVSHHNNYITNWNHNHEDRFVSQRSMLNTNESERSRSRPSVNHQHNLNQSTLSNSDNTDRTLKMGSSLAGKPLGIFSKTKKKTIDVVKELEKTIKMLNDIKPEMKDAEV
jgi:hypothetical protein